MQGIILLYTIQHNSFMFKNRINLNGNQNKKRHSKFYAFGVGFAFLLTGSFFALIVKGSVSVGIESIKMPISLTATSIFVNPFNISGKNKTNINTNTKTNTNTKPAVTEITEIENIPTKVGYSSVAIVDGKEISAPNINSTAYYAETLVKDSFFGRTHTVEHNADVKLPIASLTKLVTAVVSREGMSIDSHVKVDKEAVSTYGTAGNLKEGSVFSLKEITYPLLLTSSNDAAEAIAESYPGGRKLFISRMNEWVQKIGATKTHFVDPSGLSSGNVSTAKDLAIIAKYIYSYYPDVMAITRQKQASVRSLSWTNPTHFLNMSNYIGGKNGFTDEAGRTNISFFELERNGSRIPMVVIILGSANRDKDTLSLVDYLQKI